MKSTARLLKIWVTCLLCLNGLSHGAQAQSDKAYPERPVKLFVGFQAGAATDTLARMIGQNLTSRLNQSIVIENKPGAATRIAMDALTKSPPDGYTLAVANAVTTLFPMMFNGMKFEPGKDFMPITLLGRSPSFIAIKSSLPVQNFKEFAQFAQGKNYPLVTRAMGPIHTLQGWPWQSHWE